MNRQLVNRARGELPVAASDLPSEPYGGGFFVVLDMSQAAYTKLHLLIAMVLTACLFAAIASVVWYDTTGRGGSNLGRQFSYDLDEYRKVPPELILYEQVSEPVPLGTRRARSICVGPDQGIYVVGDRFVLMMDAKGAVISEFTLPAEALCVAVDAEGSIFLGMTDHVERWDPSGKLLARWEPYAAGSVLTSLAVTKQGVWVADAGQRKVHFYDPAGERVRSFGEFQIPSPHFDLAMGGDNLLRVSHPGLRRLEEYTTLGELVYYWGQSSLAIEGFCGCCNPVNFALLPDGQGYVTCEKGLTRVKVYDLEGKFVGVVAGAESFRRHDQVSNELSADTTASALDVAIDGAGRVLVLDPCIAEIRFFARKQQEQSP
ncbi:MAG: hypothetical protein JW810_11905 [Sedimentisphaerales bacterium]|nr:hypothetical protein [Sedimentisphaerales bacterium]